MHRHRRLSLQPLLFRFLLHPSWLPAPELHPFLVGLVGSPKRSFVVVPKEGTQSTKGPPILLLLGPMLLPEFP